MTSLMMKSFWSCAHLFIIGTLFQHQAEFTTWAFQQQRTSSSQRRGNENSSDSGVAEFKSPVNNDIRVHRSTASVSYKWWRMIISTWRLLFWPKTYSDNSLVSLFFADELILTHTVNTSPITQSSILRNFTTRNHPWSFKDPHFKSFSLPHLGTVEAYA